MFLLQLPTTVDNMASKGLRAISYQDTRKVIADFCPSQTSETLMAFTLCCVLRIIVFLFLLSPIFYQS